MIQWIYHTARLHMLTQDTLRHCVFQVDAFYYLFYNIM